MLEWIESTELSIAIREGGLPYPIIGARAFVGDCLIRRNAVGYRPAFVGLGDAAPPVLRCVVSAPALEASGFCDRDGDGLAACLGGAGQAVWQSRFWVKMSLFALVGVHALVFRAKVYGHPEKLDAGISSPRRSWRPLLS